MLKKYLTQKISKNAITEKYQSEKDFFNDSLYVLIAMYLKIIGRWPYQTARERKLFGFCAYLSMLTVVIPEVE